jgi:hypothetical protein
MVGLGCWIPSLFLELAGECMKLGTLGTISLSGQGLATIPKGTKETCKGTGSNFGGGKG